MQNKDALPVKLRTKKRAFVVSVCFFTFAAFLIANVFSLSVIKYQYYKEKAFDQLTTISPLRAERGNIYDSNMNVLATTETCWRIFISTREIRSKIKEDGINYDEIIAGGLSEILGLDRDKLLKKIQNTTVLDVTVKNAATEEEYKKVLAFSKESGVLDLIGLEAQSSRVYPMGTTAAHVLGFTGSDNQGLYGLEYYYDSTLRGKDGSYLYAKDANGTSMPGEYTTLEDARDGYSLVTTLDSYVQGELEAILEQIRVNHSVTNRVTGIVMDTKTGAILAMATSSPFDPNSPYTLDSVSQSVLDNSGFATDSEEYKKLKTNLLQVMWSNKAVSETYEPGSTFKIITVCAALDSGAAKVSDTFSCPGYHVVGGWRIKCHKTTGHGSGFNLAYGLQMSCNPAMMTIAERIGAEGFYSYVEAFGYLEKSGIDLPSEARTIFHDLNAIGSTELATASFGQRFKVSIINHLTAIAAVANGGVLVEPYVVEKIIDSDGNVISRHEVVNKGQVISEEVAKEVSAILEEGVSGDGGAKNAYVDGYSVAAKTGTSQKFDVLDANGNSYLRIGSTVAYAPYNEGGIAAIIVVDEPQSQVKYGSTVAAPYISDLFEKVLPYLEYESTAESRDVVVENYVGMNINTVRDTLNKSGVKFEIIGNGQVVLAQSPEAVSEINREISIIKIYTEPQGEEYVTVPNVTGLSLAEANRIIINSGLNVKIKGVNNSSGADVVVTYQSIAPGEKLKRGAVLEIRAQGTDFKD